MPAIRIDESGQLLSAGTLLGRDRFRPGFVCTRRQALERICGARPLVCPSEAHCPGESPGSAERFRRITVSLSAQTPSYHLTAWCSAPSEAEVADGQRPRPVGRKLDDLYVVFLSQKSDRASYKVLLYNSIICD